MPPLRIDDIDPSFGGVKAINGVMKKGTKVLLWIGIAAALAAPAFAETRTVSWDPVTTYTDGTPIEAGKTVTYSTYWTTDPGLGSLRTLGASIASTSTTFDPTVQGMPRGGTVYFTAKAVLNTGEESALSPGYAWVVPPSAEPPPPTEPPAYKPPPAPPTGGIIIRK
jgi:hypothetical protein